MNSNKIPNPKYNAHSLFTNRWSPRSFDNRMINHDDMQRIFEAASWAASAMNEQPWRYTYAMRSDDASFSQLLACLNPANAVWAHHASVLIIASIKTTFTSNQKPNGSALHDLGLANQNLILQAQSIDIYSHVMGGFDRDKARAVLNTAEDINPVVMIAMGYLGDPALLSEELQAREISPRSRKNLEEFVVKI